LNPGPPQYAARASTTWTRYSVTGRCLQPYESNHSLTRYLLTDLTSNLFSLVFATKILLKFFSPTHFIHLNVITLVMFHIVCKL
jgi:hypothetical protein